MKIIKLLSVSVLFFCCLIAKAQEKFQTNTVSLFKNGSAFFIKNIKLKKPSDGQYFLDNLPQAAFGTLWFSSPTSFIKEVKTHTKKFVRVEEEKGSSRSSDFKSMLKANLNRMLTLHLVDGKNVTGQVEKLDGNFLIINSETKWVNLNIKDIKRIDFQEKPIYPDRTWVERDTIASYKKGILIDFESKKSEQELEMMYLQKGIGWIPSYHINLETENKASLKLQAEVINDAEDIAKTDLNFVIGLPSFSYENQMSPMAGNSKNKNFDWSFRNQRNNTGLRSIADLPNRGNNSIAYHFDRSSNSTGKADNMLLKGASVEDLFFYTLNDVSLKKGDRAMFSILETELAVKHFYEVKLNENTSDKHQNANSSGYTFEENFKNKVWHTLELTNNTSTPFTAGALIVTKTYEDKMQAISQDRINYTPAGGKAFLRLTVAPDVSVRDIEKEVARVEKLQRISGYQYDLVTIEGEVKLINYKDKTVDLKLSRRIHGELKSATPNWQNAVKLPKHGLLNEINDVTWEVQLKAGEQKIVQYQYDILLRNR